MHIHQLNLHPHLGGGEIFTAFLCRGLAEFGVTTTLYCHPKANFWEQLQLPETTRLIRAEEPADVAAHIPSTEPQWLLSHGGLPMPLRSAALHLRTAIAHMPAYGRRPQEFAGHDMVFPVSAYVREGLRANQIEVWSDPLYGVANLQRAVSNDRHIVQTSCYEWDNHKGRDQLLSLLDPLIERFRTRPVYQRPDSGLRLGIVSRLTPIKQFPKMFETLAPVLARYPEITLDIFGSGGYASVRDLKRSLAPIGNRARFWGLQKDVAAVYAQLDYLLTGLPEKEALGLNVIEAQAVGTPVLAINAPPFIETVLDGVTGFLYTDPRLDDGADFAQLIERLHTAKRIDPRDAVDHIARFSAQAFNHRLQSIVQWAQTALELKSGKDNAALI